MKNNNKLVVSALLSGLLIVPAFSSTALADFGTDVTGTVQISDTDSSETLDFDTSPGVQFSFSTSANQFAISATSANATSDFRMEFAIYSQATGYYQQPNPDQSDGTIANIYQPTADFDNTNPFTGGKWNYMGSKTATDGGTDGTSTDGTSTDGTSTDGTSTDGSSA